MLGLMMLCIVSIGLFTFDCYFGLVLIPTMLLVGVDLKPANLWGEAFGELHTKLGVGGGGGGDAKEVAREPADNVDAILNENGKGGGGGIDVEGLINGGKEDGRSDLELEMEPLNRTSV